MVLYNQAQFTLECLRLLKLQRNVTYEVIIIDNASIDATQELLDHCQNTVVVKNSENVGFLRAANQGANIAKGKNLLFLNNDIWYLNEDALALALNLVNSDQMIGAVGGKVLLSHGYLQEAGVSIKQCGTHQYCREQAPDIFEGMFQRQVDCCSGVFLLTPKSIFESLDGFDMQYKPAYLEDTDYCLRLNYAGLKVVYEPRIIIGHIENGSEVKKGNARTQYGKNIGYFTNKHKIWLQALSRPSDLAWSNLYDQLISRHHRRDSSRLLFVGRSVPSQYTLNLMKSACDSDSVVSYYPLEKFNILWDKIYELFDIRIEVCKGLKLSGFDKFINNRRGYYDQIIDENGDVEKWSKYSQFLKGYPKSVFQEQISNINYSESSL